MKYIYIDESGDFGFSAKSTKTVIIAASFTDSAKNLSGWLKRMKRRKLKSRLRKKNEIKAAGAEDKFLKYFYTKANSDLNFSVYVIVIEKNQIPNNLRGEEGLIYLKAVTQLVEISKAEIDQAMFWYFDRRTLKKVSWELIAQNIRLNLLSFSKNKKPLIEIHSFDSSRNINLQFADFIAYAVFKSVDQNDNRWMQMIKSHIKKIEKLKFI